MAEYRITGVKKGDTWYSEQYKKEFQTYALALSGLGEPVKLNKVVPVNKEPQVGDVLNGSVEEKTSKNGRPYYQFKVESSYQPKSNGKSYDSDGMAWGNSLTNAVQIVAQTSKSGADAYSLARDALEIAKLFFESRPGATAVIAETKDNLQQTFGSTAKPQDTVVTDISDEPINIDDIPF